MDQSRSNQRAAVPRIWWATSLLTLAALLGCGWLVEARVFTSSSQWLWMVDLAVGWAFLACGWVAALPARQPATGGLLVATGVTWFVGTLVPDLALLHRGPLIQVLVTYPGWRPRGRAGWILVALGYATAVIPVLGRSEAVTVLLGGALLWYLMTSLRSAHGQDRRVSAIAFGCGLALVSALVAAIVVARTASTLGTATLVGYSLVLIGIAVALTLGLSLRRTGVVADLVVQLGNSPAPVLRDRLARALRDPTLEVGYWSPVTHDYRDDAGRVVPTSDPAESRVATFVARNGHEFAIVVHDATTLTDPDIADEITAAVRLGDRNADLRTDVAAQLERLAVSRGHLDNAFVEESHLLEARLASGPIAHLERIHAELAQLPTSDWPGTPHLERAREHLSSASLELGQLARGLHSRLVLDAGLAHTLERLAERSSVAVTVDAAVPSLPPQVETILWFVCSEALTNIEKHAHASHATIRVTVPDAEEVTLTVEDDGQGGADLAAGTGLRGLQERVESAGGTLTLLSEPGQGTQIHVTLPLAASDQLASAMRTQG